MNILSTVLNVLAFLFCVLILIGWIAACLRVVLWFFNPPSQIPTRLRFGYACSIVFLLTTLLPIGLLVLPALRFLPFNLEYILCATGAFVVFCCEAHLFVLTEAKVEANEIFNQWILSEDSQREQQQKALEVSFQETAKQRGEFEKLLGWDGKYFRYKFLFRKIDAWSQLSSDDRRRVCEELKAYNNMHNLVGGRRPYKIYNAKF